MRTKEPLNITIEKKLLQITKNHCEKNNRSVSSLIEELLQIYFGRVEKPVTITEIEKTLEDTIQKIQSNNKKDIDLAIKQFYWTLVKQGFLPKKDDQKKIDNTTN